MAGATQLIPINDLSSEKSSELENHGIPKYQDRLTTELVFALVGPIGSGCTTSSSIIKQILQDDYGYEVFDYHLSDYISKNATLVGVEEKRNLKGSERVEYLQDTGDKLRQKFEASYLAAKCIEDIAQRREADGFDTSTGGSPLPKVLRRAHIIDSIKHEDELKKLRDTYGEILWTIGVFAPVEKRKQRLSSPGRLDATTIDKIIRRDYRENDDHGQQVRDVFHKADFFVRNDGDNQETIKSFIARFLEIILGIGIHTPTTDESSMYAAHAEAAKSACLSRQVGAAIVNQSGDLIGLGRNDVPIFNGGLYSENHGVLDHRCFKWQGRLCHNVQRKSQIYDQIFHSMSKKGLLKDHATQTEVESAIRETAAKDLIEFSRAVHAEMDAIIAVGRNNKPGIQGSTIYVTTFPCHSCARQIVAAGIKRVIFIEPYPKSLATELHSDSISENESDREHKVLFLQFTGIAPKNILKLFLSGAVRKKTDGSIRAFNKKTARPIVAVSLDDYTTHEKLVVAELAENERLAKLPPQPTLPGV